MRVALRRHSPRARAALALVRDLALALLAVVPWLVGFLLGCLVRLIRALWALLLWIIASVRAGYEAGIDRRER